MTSADRDAILIVQLSQSSTPAMPARVLRTSSCFSFPYLTSDSYWTGRDAAFCHDTFAPAVAAQAPVERLEGETGMGEAPQADFSFDLLSSPEGVQLAKAFMSIDDAKVRRRVVDLVSTLVEGTRKK